MPSEIRKLHDDYHAKGLRVVAVSIQESHEKADGWRRKTGVPFAIALDPQGVAAQAYGVRATPTVFLIKRDGTFVGAAQGNRPWTSPEGRAVIEQALGS